VRSEYTKLPSSTSFLGGNFSFLSKSVSLFIGLAFWCSETICLLHTMKKRSGHQRRARNTPSRQVQLFFWVATSFSWSSLSLSSLA
jgi:hypothetical protein